MKSKLLIGILVAAAVIIIGAAGIAYAQSATPSSPAYPYGSGMMGGGWGGFGGMMGAWQGNKGSGSYGPMHEYMLETFADALGLTSQELQEQLDAGQTMWEVAQAQGLSDEQITELMEQAHDAALEQLVADGVLTQEQADWMDDHMEQMWAGGYGPGSCHGANSTGGFPGAFLGGMMRGIRPGWSNAQQPSN